MLFIFIFKQKILKKKRLVDFNCVKTPLLLFIFIFKAKKNKNLLEQQTEVNKLGLSGAKLNLSYKL